MKHIAIILAGGSGERLGFEKPKQFLKFAGKTCLEHTIDVFYAHRAIDCIIVVANPKWIDETRQIIAPYKSLIAINGGATRNQSTFLALQYIQSHIGKNMINVIIHDAARPLLNRRIIDDCIEALKHYKAIDVAVKAIDTIIQAKPSCIITQIDSIPNRDLLYYGQTPQCFCFALLKQAYDKAYKDNPNLDTFSDDCGLFQAYNPSKPIIIIQGDYSNHKLTRIEDIPLIDRLFQIKTTRLDSNIDLHTLKNKVIVVFGGTSGIGEEIVRISRIYNAKCYAFSRRTNCNITNPNDVDSALRHIYAKEGVIDCVINMAGILYKNELYRTANHTIDELIAINYTGAIYIAKYAYNYLAESKGMLVFASSSSYSRGREKYSIYSSLKAGIVNLTQALSDEWQEIKVNCIVPSRTLTPMRVANFGIESEDSLLKADFVATKILHLYLTQATGVILQIQK